MITLAAYAKIAGQSIFTGRWVFEVKEEEIEAGSGCREYIMQGESK